MDNMKPLTQSELKDAIAKFCESASEYSDPRPREIVEHTFYAEESFIEVSFP